MTRIKSHRRRFEPARSARKDEEPTGQGVARKKPRKRSKQKARQRRDSEGYFSHPVILISLAAVVVILALLGAFVPSVRWPVGVALTVPGLILCLYGYASGVYIAFTEDDFHGWLCLLFPFYAAYYLVSRWDDMSSRLIMVVVGLVLLGIGGRMLEVEFTRAAAAAESRKADVDRMGSRTRSQTTSRIGCCSSSRYIGRPLRSVTAAPGSMPRLW